MAGRVPAIARFQETWLGLPANLRGGIWILLSALFFSLTEAAVKALGRTMHPFEITFLRYLFGFLLLSPLFWRMGWAGLRSERLPLQLFRVAIACSGQLCIFYAVIHLMLAEAVAFQFGRPLFITIFAAPLLGEVVGWRRWAATVIGFLGILAIARPGQMSFDPFSLVAVAGAALFAGSAIIIRRLSTTDSANQIIFYYHAGGIVLFAVPAYLVWQTPTLEEWPLIILLCLFTTAAMFFFVRGYHTGEASAIGPIKYTRIVYATLLGYFLFSEVPDFLTWTGVVIIFGATLYVARQSSRASPPGG